MFTLIEISQRLSNKGYPLLLQKSVAGMPECRMGKPTTGDRNLIVTENTNYKLTEATEIQIPCTISKIAIYTPTLAISSAMHIPIISL